MNQIIEFFEAIWEWSSSSTAAKISFTLNIVMLLFTIFSFFMYFQQKREYRLLFDILKDYNLLRTVKKDKNEVFMEYQKIKEMYRDLKERLPIEARRVYYENTIPILQKQIFDLKEQLDGMTEELKACGGEVKEGMVELDAILSKEIQKYMLIRRNMEREQMKLTIYMAAIASIGILFPFPFNLLAIPLGVGVLQQCLSLFRLWKIYYQRQPPRDQQESRINLLKELLKL